MLTSFTEKRPVLTYIILAFGITWVLGVIVGILLGPLEAKLGWENRPFSMFLIKFGPSIAGLLTAYFLNGMEGMVELLKQGGKWMVSFPVLAFVIAAPVLFMIILLLIWSPDRGLDLFSWSTLGILFSTAFLKIFLGGGFGEEFGWRGLMLPKLIQRMSPFFASLAVGIVWILWHLPVLVLGGSVGNPVVFVATIMSYSVILTWIYYSSGGSILWAAVFHGWTNALSNTLDNLLGDQLADVEIYINMGYAGLMLLSAILLLLIYGKNLGMKITSSSSRKFA